MNIDRDCTFCNEIHGYQEDNFYQMYLRDEFTKNGLKSRIVAETSNFLLLPMVGALVPGYLLLLPKEHYLSFSHLPNELLDEAMMIKQIMKEIFQKEYTTPVFFEHGPMSMRRSGGCCSRHAHLHIVAVDVDVSVDLGNAAFAVRGMDNFCDIRKQSERDVPYLYYENQLGEKIIMDAPNVYPQYIRCLIAKRLDKIELSSWQRNHQIPWMIDIIKRLRPIFQKEVDDGFWRESNSFI